MEVGPVEVAPVEAGPVGVGGGSSPEMTSAITVATTTTVTTSIETRAMPLKGFFRGPLGGGSGCISLSLDIGSVQAIVTRPARRAARALRAPNGVIRDRCAMHAAIREMLGHDHSLCEPIEEAGPRDAPRPLGKLARGVHDWGDQRTASPRTVSGRRAAVSADRRERRDGNGHGPRARRDLRHGRWPPDGRRPLGRGGLGQRRCGVRARADRRGRGGGHGGWRDERGLGGPRVGEGTPLGRRHRRQRTGAFDDPGVLVPRTTTSWRVERRRDELAAAVRGWAARRRGDVRRSPRRAPVHHREAVHRAR